MTPAINSSTKLLSIDITKRAYSDYKELKRQRFKKKKVGIKEKKRKENLKEKERKKKKINKK